MAAEHPPHLKLAIRQTRRLVHRRALLAAGVAVVPVPGLDWATDVGVLVRLLPQINAVFGLHSAQIDQLAPEQRVLALRLVRAGGHLVLGQVVTHKLVLEVLRVVGVRMATQQAAKFVPLVGQAASALLTYSALRWVCERHIQQCAAVASQLLWSAPPHPTAHAAAPG